MKVLSNNFTMPSTRSRNIITIGLLLFSFALSLWLGYKQFVASETNVFFGNDTFSHLVSAQSANKLTLQSPLFFQWLVRQASAWLSVDLVVTYSWASLLSLPLAILSTSLLAYSLFGRRVAILTSFIFGWVSIQPLQTYQDGTLPNIYSIGVFFPLFLIFLHTTFDRNRSRLARVASSALTITAGVLVAITHHLSTLVAGLVILLSLLMYGVWLMYSLPKKYKWLSLIPLFLVQLSVVLIFSYAKSSAAFGLLQPSISFTDHFPWIQSLHMFSQGKSEWNASLFGTQVGSVPFQFGFVGALYVLLRLLSKTGKSPSFVAVVVMIWFVFYYFGSRSPYVYEPTRLARDLALPGSILSAYALVSLWNIRKQFPAIVFNTVAVVFLLACQYSFVHRLSMLTTKITTPYMQEDFALVKKITTSGKQLAVLSDLPFFSMASNTHGFSINNYQNPSEAAKFYEADQNNCVLQLAYKTKFAGLGGDPLYAQPLLLEEQRFPQLFDSPTRLAWLFCHTNTQAMLSQNTYTTGVKK